jgi:hypothetical protein
MTLSGTFSHYKSYFTRDRIVLLACILIALIFWFLNKLSTSYRQTKTLRIEYVLPQGKAFSKPPPQYVTATFQGTGWDLLFGRTDHITINMTGDSLQFYSMRNVLAQQYQSEIVGVNIDQISLITEPAASKTVPIQAVVDLSFAKGFDLSEDVQLTPSVVTVSGPRSVIQNLFVILTDTLKLSKLKDSLTIQKVTLAPNPLLLSEITKVSAAVRVEQFTEKSMFIPIVVKNAPEQLKIFPNKIKLDCTVALSRYEELNVNSFTAEVDLSNVTPTSKNNTASINLTKKPTFARNIKFSPKSAEFFVEQ